MQHHNYYGTNKFEFCNVKRETQDIGQSLFVMNGEDFLLCSSIRPNITRTSTRAVPAISARRRNGPASNPCSTVSCPGRNRKNYKG